MSFEKGNSSDISKASWVKVPVLVPDANIVSNENERLLGSPSTLPNDHDEVALTAEAIPYVDTKQNEVVEDHTQYPPPAVVAASGTAGCVLGCLLGGLGCALVGGLGSAYAAKNKAGTCLGDSARAMGEVALLVREKAVAVNEKHDVVKTTKEAATTTYAKAKALDEQYHICEKGKTAITSAGKAAIDFAARHQMVEQSSAEGLERGLENLGGNFEVASSNK